LKKKLNILIYSLAAGGAERVVSTLLFGLDEYFEITLVLMNDTIEYEIPKSLNIQYIEKSQAHESGVIKLLKLPFLAYKYSRVCSNNKPDYSLSFMNRSNYTNVLSKVFGNKSKIFISERIAPSKEYESNSVKDKISQYLIKYLYPKADRIFPNSKGIAYDLKWNFKIQEEKIHVINNPIDIAKIKKLSKEDVNDFNFNKFTFINVARLHSQKNHELLIRAYSKINADTQLLIIGEGELRPPLERLIRELNLNNKVFLIGKKQNPFKYLSHSKCFVFSSNYEGFPNGILEALACELPVISTDCKSGPRELLDIINSNGIEKNMLEPEYVDHGILVPLNNVDSLTKAMTAIIESDTLINKFSKIAYNRALKYDRKIIIDEYIKVMEN